MSRAAPVPRPVPPGHGDALRVGIVCPYSLDVPGGVQAHVVGLAWALEGLGHEVRVLAPAADDTPVPAFVTATGRARAPGAGSPRTGSTCCTCTNRRR